MRAFGTSKTHQAGGSKHDLLADFALHAIAVRSIT
jgi:hypothetical protein